MKIAPINVTTMVNVIKENASAIKDGLVPYALINFANQIVTVMENATTEHASASKALKASLVLILM
jgi:hypothetical protein